MRKLRKKNRKKMERHIGEQKHKKLKLKQKKSP
jgi:hypothetical protein